jgi:adenosine deaminase
MASASQFIAENLHHPKPPSGSKIPFSLLGAERIGHGIQAIHHTDIMDILKTQNILLEVCPYSNYLTQAFKTYGDHPLKKLKDLGVPVSINSDDPGMFASTLSDDYWIAHNHQNFTVQILTTVINLHSNTVLFPKQKRMPHGKCS